MEPNHIGISYKRSFMIFLIIFSITFTIFCKTANRFLSDYQMQILDAANERTPHVKASIQVSMINKTLNFRTEWTSENIIMQDVQIPTVDGANCTALFHGDKQEIESAIAYQNNDIRKFKQPEFYISATKSCDQFITTRQYVTEPVSAEEAAFSIAYTIMMYKEPEMTERLLRAIYRPQNYYCIHVDLTSDQSVFDDISAIANCFDNVVLSDKRIDVQWGKMTVLKSDLSCFKTLWKFQNWKYMINLTGQEFPLKTNLEIVKILHALQGANNVEASKEVMRQEMGRLLNKKHPPNDMAFAKGGVHVALIRGAVDFILHNPVAVAFQKWLDGTFFPEETFFASLNTNPQLGMPGAYTGNDATPYDLNDLEGKNAWIVRRKQWDYLNIPCAGEFCRRICIISVGDLFRLNNAPHMFVNKLHLDFHPIAYDCLEQRIFQRVKKEIAGKSSFNTTLYSTLDFVKHHI